MKKRGNDSAGSAALFLCPEAPYPVAGGGALRSASLFEYLASRYAMDVVLFREPGTADPRQWFPEGLARRICVLDLPYHQRHAGARAWRNARRIVTGVTPLVDRFSGFGRAVERFTAGHRYEVAVVEHSWCAGYYKQAAAAASRTVLDLHNIESVLHSRCGRSEPAAQALVHRVFARASLAFEREWLPRYGCLLAASEQDAGKARRIAPGARVLVYPNALPAVPLPPRAEEHALAFSGNMEYHPNLSAVRFFVRDVWPALRARNPELVWRLVGKNEHAVRRYAAPGTGIECSGPVADAVSELARVKVAVVPLLAASGTRLKILEAWAAGTPVVSTRVGAEGLPVIDGENILLADSPANFREAVEALLANHELRRRIGLAGRSLFESCFTWQAAWSRLDL